jgi:hypothetical protein
MSGQSNESMLSSNMGLMLKKLDSFHSQLTNKVKGTKIDKSMLESELEQIMTWPLGAVHPDQ